MAPDDCNASIPPAGLRSAAVSAAVRWASSPAEGATFPPRPNCAQATVARASDVIFRRTYEARGRWKSLHGSSQQTL